VLAHPWWKDMGVAINNHPRILRDIYLKVKKSYGQYNYAAI